MSDAAATCAARLKQARPWYRHGLQFTCTQCGRCCGGAPGYVWISPGEIERVARHLGLETAEFARRHVRRVGAKFSLLERSNGDCEFLERDESGSTRCSIHPVRPVQCRTWPFWRSNLRSRRAWDQAARDCPGMNTGQRYPLPVIQRALRQNEAADLDL